jgi:lipoprotein signal peptidase
MSTRLRRLLAVAVAVVVATAVVADEALTPSPYHHPRSGGALALIALLAALVLAVVPRVRSTAASIGAGLAAGGAIAMLVSGLVWQAGVPDPLVGGSYAFNLADVALVLGDVTFLIAAVVHGWDNRHALRRPV